MTDLNFVTIADQEWELAPADSPTGSVGDALLQTTLQDKYEEAETLERGYKRRVALLRKQGISDDKLPDPPDRLVELFRELSVASWRSTLQMLNLAPDDAEMDDERPTKAEFLQAIGDYYRQKNGGPVSDEDLSEITHAITEAWMARVEAETAIPPKRSGASAPGPQAGKAVRASKRSPKPASKTSR